ncbi:MAG: ABC-F family ATP-binding cassette domain-containing protein [Bacillota bacterium]|nr:ABC-F family ATP-binding cassette domain-containing protein [Bacillota bacterium]
MPLLELEDVGWWAGDRPVLEGVSAAVEPRQRIGVVGRNGGGKSTLLRLMAGELLPDEGSVRRRPGLRVRYVRQEAGTADGRSAWERAEAAFAELRRLEAEMHRLEIELAEGRASPADLERYGLVQARFQSAGGWSYRNRIETVLRGVGLAESRWRLPSRELSGGERVRLELAAALLDPGDVLLLDEPTNHLDLEAVAWLEEALQALPAAVVVVAHDRHLLDRVPSVTWEVAGGRLRTYPGGYSHYAELRRQEERRQEAEEGRRRREAARLRAFIERNRAGQLARQAKSREKRLERLLGESAGGGASGREPGGVPRLGAAADRLAVAGALALRLERLSIGRGGYRAGPFSAELRVGERVAVVGPNGAGKSTLLATLAGALEPLGGTLLPGPGLRVTWLAQGRWPPELEALPPERSLLDALLELRPLDREEAHRWLARFGWPGETALRPLAGLSGGERARLALLLALMEPCDLLLLDEPTNHLDLETREALERTLARLPAALVVVSHDRTFLTHVAGRLWLVEGGRIRELPEGTALLAGEGLPWAAGAAARPAPPATGSGEGRVREAGEHADRRGGAQSREAAARGRATLRRRQAELAELEARIEALEEERDRLRERLTRPPSAQEELTRLGERYQALEAELENAYGRWLEMAEDSAAELPGGERGAK